MAPAEDLNVSGNIQINGSAGLNRYIITNETNSGTGTLTVQAGAGSAGYGGSIKTYAHSHESKPGWVTAGISANAGTVGTPSEGRFTVNSQGLGGGADLLTVLRSGNVGIGTNTPSSPLELYKISSSGSSITPLLELTNSMVEPASGDGQSIEFHNLWASSSPRAGIEMRYIGSYTDSSLAFRTRSGSNYNESMLIDNNGNVGIGTLTPTHKLSVNGTILAKEVIVESGWSDFVFDRGYYLRPLRDVETHIQDHGHLPDVPSAATVEAEGLSVGEAQKIMMQKIEELTLYMIEKDKQVAALQARVSELESK